MHRIAKELPGIEVPEFGGATLEALLRRPHVSYSSLAALSDDPLLPEELGRRVEIEVDADGESVTAFVYLAAPSVELDDLLRARVKLDLDPSLELSVDSTARILTSGVLGDQFVALEPPAYGIHIPVALRPDQALRKIMEELGESSP